MTELCEKIKVAVDETLKCYQISEKRANEIKGTINGIVSKSANKEFFEVTVLMYLSDLILQKKIKPLTGRKIKFELKKLLSEDEKNGKFIELLTEITKTE